MSGQFAMRASVEVESHRPLSKQLQATAQVVRGADEAHLEPAGLRQWRRRGFFLQRLTDTG